jgi:hypothetical protein
MENEDTAYRYTNEGMRASTQRSEAFAPQAKIAKGPTIPIGIKQFDEIMRHTFEHLEKLSATKGMEYRQDNLDNVHDNFDRQALEMDMPSEKVLMTFLNKHLDSIKTYIKRSTSGEVYPTPSEPIYGRVDDAILYLLLLKAMFMRGPLHREDLRRTVVMAGAPF